MRKTWFFAMALLLQFSVTLGLGTVVAYGKAHDRAPLGLIVWGQDLSGLSRIQVFSELKNRIPNAVLYKEHVYPLKLDRSDAEIEAWLDQVFPVTSGSWLSDVLHNLTRPSISISPNNIGLNHEEVIAQLQSLSQIINKPMRPATITYSEGRLEKTDGQPGQELDIEGTWQKISQEHEHKLVAVVVKDVPTLPNFKDIAKIQNVLGDYTTYFNPHDVSRTKNVRLAATALNNHLIPPGQVFSFNNVVGERTENSGYSPAYIFEGQSVIKGDGGGICQDSSTLYQAVLQAHLTLVEKHAHSLPVTYVLKGQDATVSYGTLDFRFQNDTQGYLLISALTGRDSLRIRLFGLADDSHPVLLNPEGYPNLSEDLSREPK
jgi:vancomycin resistance protein YoaR